VAVAEGAYLSTFMHTQRLVYSTRASDGPLLDHYGLGIEEISGLLGYAGDWNGYSAAVFHEPKSDLTLTVLIARSGDPDAATHLALALAAELGWPPK
jgi:hypothetical protein